MFAGVFGEVCGLLDGCLGLGRGVAEVVGDGVGLDETVWAQAGLFAVEVALFRLLESWGVVPDVVAGHSVGEIAAAYAAGVLSLEDACALVAARGRLMQALPSGGAMAAVGVGEAEVGPVLAGLAGVGLAAVNGPGSVVVSGDAGGVEQVVAWGRERGRRVRRLRVSHAFHSARMDPVLEELGRVAAGLGHGVPRDSAGVGRGG